VRSHHGALSRFYFEALLGLVAVRVHGAERALRREHEALLVEWARAGGKLVRGALLLRFATSLLGAGLAIALLALHLVRNGTTPAALLYAYWALSLPALGEQLALVVLQAPSMRNAARRALEPLAAPVEQELAPVAPLEAPAPLAVPAGLALKAAGALSAAPVLRRPPPGAPAPARGVALELSRVALTLGGHGVLHDVELVLAPGEHVALVGRSGAGKSSLIALVLGLQQPSAGEIRADGDVLAGEALERLRAASAWVDPAVQLWNRSAFENLVYGPRRDVRGGARARARRGGPARARRSPSSWTRDAARRGRELPLGRRRAAHAPRTRAPAARRAPRPPGRALPRPRARGAPASARPRARTLARCDAARRHARHRGHAVLRARGRARRRPHRRARPARGARGARRLALRAPLEAERELVARGWGSAQWTRWNVATGVLTVERPSERERGGQA
jgi:ATP-binding cassette subfamily B protein